MAQVLLSEKESEAYMEYKKLVEDGSPVAACWSHTGYTRFINATEAQKEIVEENKKWREELSKARKEIQELKEKLENKPKQRWFWD